jgi:hypothetical protein
VVVVERGESSNSSVVVVERGESSSSNVVVVQEETDGAP